MNRTDPLVLGIETSCDETGIGIVRGRTLLSNTIASSMDEHARYGGVVPEVAARAHLEALQPSIEAALAEAGVSLADIDAVAVTSGPGLAGALMVGVGAAKALAVALERPLYAVNHLVGHIAADILSDAPAEGPGLDTPPAAALDHREGAPAEGPGLDTPPAAALDHREGAAGGGPGLDTPPAAALDHREGAPDEGPGLDTPPAAALDHRDAAAALDHRDAAAALDHREGAAALDRRGALEYPTVALLVSGGHTSLLLVRDLTTDVELLGETMDDAAGEAFDKVARLLGLPYPGGPEIDRAAAAGDPTAIPFPRGLSRASDMAKHRYDFSFSGLKTAVARWVEQRQAEGEPIPVADVAASFREAVVDVLVTKALAACADHGVPRLLLGGGVIANRRLRDVAIERADAAGVTVRIPPLSLCTDNGAMIAALASELIMSGRPPSTLAFGADSTLPVTEIQVAESEEAAA